MLNRVRLKSGFYFILLFNIGDCIIVSKCFFEMIDKCLGIMEISSANNLIIDFDLIIISRYSDFGTLIRTRKSFIHIIICTSRAISRIKEKQQWTVDKCLWHVFNPVLFIPYREMSYFCFGYLVIKECWFCLLTIVLFLEFRLQDYILSFTLHFKMM